MDYLDDLDKCVEILEGTLAEIEKCYANGWHTAISVHKMKMDCTLKSAKFCVKCAKRKAAKLEIPENEFKCEGGCIRPGIFGQFQECNEKLWYVFHWTRFWDKRYDKKTGRWLGNTTKFWEDLKNEDTKR